jgi:hypothetical protein
MTERGVVERARARERGTERENKSERARERAREREREREMEERNQRRCQLKTDVSWPCCAVQERLLVTQNGGALCAILPQLPLAAYHRSCVCVCVCVTAATHRAT